MPETESVIISFYGDSPRMRMIEFFMQFPKHEFTVPELIIGIGMSKTTAYKEVTKLKHNDMINEVGNVGKSPTYKINLKSPIVYSMQKLVSYRSKKIADSQMMRSRKLHALLRTHMDSLRNRELMLKNELEIVQTTIEERKLLA